MHLEGIHHISCITGDARANLDFYTRVLGLRLVAKSVNQDDPSVYHLFYADEEGQPGADITFFEYPGAVPGRAGAGMIHRITWRVPSTEALGFWADRLGGEGIAVEAHSDALRFADPEGLGLEIAVSAPSDPPLRAIHPDIPVEVAIVGFDGVRAFSHAVDQSRRLLEDVMSARARDGGAWELRGSRRGGIIAYDPPPSQPGRAGAGTVHHVAWHTTVDEHPKWLERLRSFGVSSTPIIDRHYFHSIYFREPSGVLFEIADDGPGFAVDGTIEELGTRVILPPRFEPLRRELEARLTPLPDPRADWRTEAPSNT